MEYRFMSVISLVKKQLLVPLVTTLAVVSAVAATTPEANAASIVLDFEGVGDLNPVGNFYNSLGIDFSSNALGIVDADAGGSGNFGGEPSPSTALFFLGGNAATLNISTGFTTGFSFFYSAINNPGFINVFDGLNGSGNILATLNLPTTPFNGAPDPTGAFSPFIPIGVGFSGTARSIDFGGTINQIAFDDVTFGSVTPGTTPVPTPALLPGLVGLGLSAWRKRKGEEAAAEAVEVKA
jgi:hypothetical protein